MFSTVTLHRASVDEPLLSLWRRIAVHLGAGCRLSGRAAVCDAEDVECVVTPGGRVLHAAGAATGAREREVLRDAVKRVDQARCRRGRADPSKALELWRGLFAGRWSVVEHFDSDGRRFLLARRNDPNTPGASALPLRQRQVLFYAASGWSNKAVGYALGISATTVAIHLARALAQLGMRSRAEWIRVSAQVAATIPHGSGAA
jgi:DNA-binding CsgD family transcriptional regulator